MWMDVAEQIFGDISVVKKALHVISTQLHENPLRDRPQGNMGVYPPGGPFLSAGDTFLPPIDPRNLGGPLLGMGPSLSGGGPPFNNIGLPVLSDVGGMNRPAISDEELVFWILCPNEKTGSVIRKGGSVIKNLQEEGLSFMALQTDRLILIDWSVRAGSAFSRHPPPIC